MVRTARKADGTNAQATMRAMLRRAHVWPCALCGWRFDASALDVDHIVPLVDGGRDVEGNVQALCRPCHREKSAAEAHERPRHA